MNHYDQNVETGRRHYYSSSQGPFYNANNIFMFYGGGERGPIVESILASLCDSRQITHIHGEAGSGKTMMSLVLSDRLKHRCHTIRYDLPEITAAKLLRHLLIELCPQRAGLISTAQAQNGANRASIDAALDCIAAQVTANRSIADSKPYALFVDSPQALGVEEHRVIEKLSSLCFNEQTCMHCFVFHSTGRSSDRCVIPLDSEQRPDNQYWLRRLTLVEIDEYLRHHMMLFDFNRRDLFTREMAYFIADRSGGVFRSINTLARNAFTIANLEDADKLSMSHLLMAGLPVREEASTKSNFSTKLPRSTIAMMGICVVALTLMAIVLLM
jgi:type II secretory pathway predicted ATPase ExeA